MKHEEIGQGVRVSRCGQGFSFDHRVHDCEFESNTKVPFIVCMGPVFLFMGEKAMLVLVSDPVICYRKILLTHLALPSQALKPKARWQE